MLYARHSPVESAQVSPKVILISLPVNTDRDIINIVISKQGFHPIDIRIVRKATDTGIVRVFGFVEFSDSIQAQAWIDYNKGFLVLEGNYIVQLAFTKLQIPDGKNLNKSFFGGASQLLNQFQRLCREFFVFVVSVLVICFGVVSLVLSLILLRESY